MQRFLPFLPDTSAQAAEAAAASLEDVEWLLSADPAEFWGLVRADGSLLTLVDTYLRHAPRPFDEGFPELSATEHTLWQLMLALLHRIFAALEPGAPPHANRASMLTSLTTVPCLLDVCGLYGAAGSGQNRASVPALAAAMLSLRPALRAELTSAGEVIAHNMGHVVDACVAAARAASRDPALLHNALDGMAYLRDTCLALSSLLRALPAAASMLLGRGSELVEALGAVHDRCIPAAEATARSGVTLQHEVLLRRCLHVELASEKAAQLLLVHGFLDASADGGAAGKAGGAASSSTSRSGAVAQGEAFLEAFMVLGHREGEGGSGEAPPVGGWSLGPALAHRHSLAATVQSAQSSGVVALDDAQTDYLAALMDVPSLGAAPVSVAVPAGPSNGGSVGAAAAAAGGSAAAAAAMQLSLVTQVRDLLPEYGEGFVAACLEALGGSVERVVNALLEGALPAEVTHLGQAMTYQQYQQQFEQQRQGQGAKVKSKGAAGPSQVATQLSAVASQPGDTISIDRGGASTGAVTSLTARYLDAKETTYRSTIQAAAAAAQWEYEDEYDDSFDELMHLGADGLAEAEGEDAGDTELSAAGAGAGSGGALDQMQRDARGGSMQQGGRGGGRGRGGGGAGQRGGKSTTLWVLDGKVYNYNPHKPGAVEVHSAADAEQQAAQAQLASLEIGGLGPGGNVPLQPPLHTLHTEAGGQYSSGGGGGGGGRGHGRGQASTAPGGGGGRSSSQAWKDKNKAAIGNHHRKDRAAQKQARGMQ